MVRLMLVLAPVMCILGGIAVSALLQKFMKDVELKEEKKSGRGKEASKENTKRRSEVRE